MAEDQSNLKPMAGEELFSATLGPGYPEGSFGPLPLEARLQLGADVSYGQPKFLESVCTTLEYYDLKLPAVKKAIIPNTSRTNRTIHGLEKIPPEVFLNIIEQVIGKKLLHGALVPAAAMNLLAALRPLVDPYNQLLGELSEKCYYMFSYKNTKKVPFYIGVKSVQRLHVQLMLPCTIGVPKNLQDNREIKELRLNMFGDMTVEGLAMVVNIWVNCLGNLNKLTIHTSGIFKQKQRGDSQGQNIPLIVQGENDEERKTDIFNHFIVSEYDQKLGVKGTIGSRYGTMSERYSCSWEAGEGRSLKWDGAHHPSYMAMKYVWGNTPDEDRHAAIFNGDQKYIIFKRADAISENWYQYMTNDGTPSRSPGGCKR